MRKRLERSFFARPGEDVALDLLSKYLVRKLPSGEVEEGMISETEAYVGIQDLASHAAGGRRTKRTEAMFGPPGHAYIYFTYGMHWLLNAVVSKEGDPQAVLIRSLAAVSGPARLTKFLGVDGKLNGEDLAKSRELWIEDRGKKIDPRDIQTTPRIGVDYAGEWKDKPLRFRISG